MLDIERDKEAILAIYLSLVTDLQAFMHPNFNDDNKKSNCSNDPYSPYLQDVCVVISLT